MKTFSPSKQTASLSVARQRGLKQALSRQYPRRTAARIGCSAFFRQAGSPSDLVARGPFAWAMLALCFLALCPPLALAQGGARSAPMMLDDAAAAPPPRIVDPDAMVRLVASALCGEASDAPDWMMDQALRFVSVTVRPPGEPPRRASGTGAGLWPALSDAVHKLRQMGVRPETPPPLRVEVANRFQQPSYSRFGFWGGMTVGVDGLAFLRSSGVALFPLEIAAAGPEYVSGALSPMPLLRIIPETSASAPLRDGLRTLREVPVRTFRAAAFYSDGENPTVMLWGGHEAIRPVTRERLSEALDLAADAYMRVMKSDGEFVHRYDPATGREVDEPNLVRQAGALWAMARLAERTGRDDLRSALRGSARALLRHRRRFGQADALCLVEDDTVKLGAVALGALALARSVEALGGDAFLASAAEQLGETMLLAQDDRGRFTSLYRYSTLEPDLGWQSRYFPSQAVLALTGLHRLTGEEKWLDAAERGARYLVEVRDGDTLAQDLDHDHWLLIALDELRRLRPDPLWVEHAKKLSLAIANTQNRDASAPWRLGAFQGQGDLDGAATLTEGLCAAWSLLRRAGEDSEADAISDAAGFSAAFVLRMQYRDASLLDVKDPAYLKGQFPRGIGRPEAGSDSLQHGVTALLRTLEAMEAKGVDTLPRQR